MGEDFFLAILAMMEADRGREQLLEDERLCEEEELGQRGNYSLEEISSETGLSLEQVQQAMRDARGQFMHRVASGQRSQVLYGLTKQREGQPGWEPGVDF